MADIRLIAIIPQQPVPGVQSTQVPQGLGRSPTILNNLSPGSILSGFIINRDPQGNPILRTDKGDIAFESSFFLKIGSEVVIRIQNTAGQTLAHILTVNGQPPELAEAQSAFAQETDILFNQPGSTTSTRAPTQAVVTTPPPSTIIATLLTGQIGTQLTLKLLAIHTAPPASEEQATSHPASATPTSPNSSLYAAYARTAGTAPGQQPVVHQNTFQGQSFQPAIQSSIVHVNPLDNQISPPAETPTPAISSPLPPQENKLSFTGSTVITTSLNTPAPATVQPGSAELSVHASEVEAPYTPPAHTIPQQGQVIQASVIGHEPSGEALVQTPAGILRLQPGVVLSSGTALTFEISEITPPALQTAGALARPDAPAALTDLAQQWDTLQQVFTLLAERDSQLGINTLPTIPWPAADNVQGREPIEQPAISAGLLVFVTALRGGDFRNWLGRENARWLETQGHGALVDKASGEFSMLSRQFANPPQGQWQTLFFPIAVEGQVQQVRMFTKRDRKQGNTQEGKKEGDDTRFVVEMDLSQLGEMQMDGFVRRREEEMQFDLVIRSQRALPDDVQSNIAQIYQSTAELTGYRGQLAFQTVKTFPVNPMEDIAQQHIRDMKA